MIQCWLSISWSGLHALLIPYGSHLRLQSPSSRFPSGLLRSHPGEKPGSGGSRRYHTWPRPPTALPADSEGPHGGQANRGSRSSVALVAGPGCKNHWVIVLQWWHMGVTILLFIQHMGVTTPLFIQQLVKLTSIKHQSSALLNLCHEKHWWPIDSPHKGTVMRKVFVTCHDVITDYGIEPLSTPNLIRLASPVIVTIKLGDTYRVTDFKKIVQERLGDR